MCVSLIFKRQIGKWEGLLIVTHPIMVISCYTRSMLPAVLYTCIHAHLRRVISMQVETLRWDKKFTGMKTAASLEENVLHCKALLLHCHGNGEESMCWSQSLKVTQSLHVLIIPLPYERNITSLVSMMKIHIRSFQPVHLSNEHGEPAIKVKTRKWTAHIAGFINHESSWWGLISDYYMGILFLAWPI